MISVRLFVTNSCKMATPQQRRDSMQPHRQYPPASKKIASRVELFEGPMPWSLPAWTRVRAARRLISAFFATLAARSFIPSEAAIARP